MNNILGFDGTLDDFFDAAASGQIDLEVNIVKMKKILKEIKKDKEYLQSYERNILMNQKKIEQKNRKNEEYLIKCQKILDNRNEAIVRSVRDSTDDCIISINVGGKVFTSLKSTFSRLSPYLENMLLFHCYY